MNFEAITFILLLFFALCRPTDSSATKIWKIQSIDTVKYSRDLARDKLFDQDFQVEIDTQIKNIATAGATHVAIGTPYDEEFLPYLKRWVTAARKYNLKVWFKGNWSGWENWFDYPPISPEDHINKTRDFILLNSYLFENGDIFSSCPECENGVIGDPRTGKVNEFRRFLVDEANASNKAFKSIDKQVASNYFPLNGDVAMLVMDENTTANLGGVVVVDHYAADVDNLKSYLLQLIKQSKGEIVIGEFGAPIDDIHGNFDEQMQSEWIKNAFDVIYKIPKVVGINYWTNMDSSTSLWNKNNSPKLALSVLESAYKPKVAKIILIDNKNKYIKNALVLYSNGFVVSNSDGEIKIPYLNESEIIRVSKDGYYERIITVHSINKDNRIVLSKKPSVFSLKFYELISRIMSSRMFR